MHVWKPDCFAELTTFILAPLWQLAVRRLLQHNVFTYLLTYWLTDLLTYFVRPRDLDLWENLKIILNFTRKVYGNDFHGTIKKLDQSCLGESSIQRIHAILNIITHRKLQNCPIGYFTNHVHVVFVYFIANFLFIFVLTLNDLECTFELSRSKRLYEFQLTG